MGVSKDCCLIPLLYTMFSHDCMALHEGNRIMFADDATVIGFISNDDQGIYREQVTDLTVWCKNNHLSLKDVDKNELIIDLRKSRGHHVSLTIHGTCRGSRQLQVLVRPDLSLFHGPPTTPASSGRLSRDSSSRGS